MTRLYHERFFSDIRFSTVASLALFTLGFWEVPAAFLLVPPVALLGAASTAFDASYLIFARQYAARLERWLNGRIGSDVLVASELEATYLFPLDEPKMVVASFGKGFSWFGFMTVLYTATGAATYLFGLALGWDTLMAATAVVRAAYLAVLFGLTAASLVVGFWWFVGGEGERRLATVLDARLP